jgi:hypothetical protein
VEQQGRGAGGAQQDVLEAIDDVLPPHEGVVEGQFNRTARVEWILDGLGGLEVRVEVIAFRSKEGGPVRSCTSDLGGVAALGADQAALEV